MTDSSAATQAPAIVKTADRAPVRFGFAPQTIEEAYRVATYLAKSDLIPKGFKNKPEDVLVAIQMGAELGMPPMQALQSIAVINGRPGLWGDGLLALILSSPLCTDHDEFYEVGGQRRDGLQAEDWKLPETAAVCTFVRQGKATPITRRFTVAQAKKANLLGKDGPWQTYPDRMLAMRARGFAARDAFPDLLRGVRAAEELADLPRIVEEATPATVHRLSERALDVPAPKPDPPKPPPPPPPPSPDVMTIGPVQVARVETLLGGPCATLANGVSLWIPDTADAAELAKFVGTDHPLIFTVDHDGPWPVAADSWRLVSFAIAH